MSSSSTYVFAGLAIGRKCCIIFGLEGYTGGLANCPTDFDFVASFLAVGKVTYLYPRKGRLDTTCTKIPKIQSCYKLTVGVDTAKLLHARRNRYN